MKQRSRYKGLKKQLWFSLCSQHSVYDENCSMCNHGSWRNAFYHKIENIIYNISSKLWMWIYIDRQIK